MIAKVMKVEKDEEVVPLFLSCFLGCIFEGWQKESEKNKHTIRTSLVSFSHYKAIFQPNHNRHNKLYGDEDSPLG